jgi:hypothetical protein
VQQRFRHQVGQDRWAALPNTTSHDPSRNAGAASAGMPAAPTAASTATTPTSGLVAGERSGRSVLYLATELGLALLDPPA